MLKSVATAAEQQFDFGAGQVERAGDVVVGESVDIAKLECLAAGFEFGVAGRFPIEQKFESRVEGHSMATFKMGSAGVGELGENIVDLEVVLGEDFRCLDSFVERAGAAVVVEHE